MCPECKVFDRDQHIPAVHDRVHRQSRSLVKITTISELEFRRSRIIRPDNWTCRRMVTKHFTLDNILSRVAQAPQHALFFGVFGKTVISIHTDHV